MRWRKVLVANGHLDVLAAGKLLHGPQIDSATSAANAASRGLSLLRRVQGGKEDTCREGHWEA